jgi:hypothetical protein
MLDRREYEEYYGEHVGTCSIHGTVLDGCQICEDEEREPDWRSQCCDASPFYAEGIIDLDYSTLPNPSGFCGHCLDTTLFEDAHYD